MAQDDEADEMYCERHDVKEPHYKGSDDEHCVYCREERALESQRMHQMTRDPTVEPW